MVLSIPDLKGLSTADFDESQQSITRLDPGVETEFAQTLLAMLCETYKQIFFDEIEEAQATRQDFESTNGDAFKIIESLTGMPAYNSHYMANVVANLLRMVTLLDGG